MENPHMPDNDDQGQTQLADQNQQGQQNQNSNGNNQGNGPGAGDDDDGGEDDLTSLFSAFGEEETTPPQIQTPEQLAQSRNDQTTAMVNELRTGIAQLALPPDLMPADFDSTDRAQLSSMLTNFMRHVTTQAIQLSMRPVQMALQQQHTQLSDGFKAQLSQAMGGERESSRLAAEFPLIDHAQYGGMFKSMNEKMVKNKAPLDKRVKAMKALAKQLNIPLPNKQQQQSNQPGMEILTGSSALNDLFGNPG